MVAIAATQTKSKLLRYWTSETLDAPGDLRIRIEWLSKEGVTHTTCGRYFADDHAITWDYDEPTARVESYALDCALDAGVYTTHREIAFGGVESYEAMCAAVESHHCEGCDQDRETRAYSVTFTSGQTEPCRYCTDCAALARMNWNGETASIAEAV